MPNVIPVCLCQCLPVALAQRPVDLSGSILAEGNVIRTARENHGVGSIRDLETSKVAQRSLQIKGAGESVSCEHVLVWCRTSKVYHIVSPLERHRVLCHETVTTQEPDTRVDASVKGRESNQITLFTV